ncbi:ABC transporter permease [Roseovarius gahaiensis]|uniref:ABC transporter permease n=1 Tax=Roseovarius gahaiensis TaxID=2716691 RepID=A0A967BGM6_9RHOB|nr:ABC transporter permease [Roseovarius gahaiensis]NHQ73797.1 ABC transporter permease [Roseovarius gahaiensis]
MKSLLKGYGGPLTAFFFGAVLVWGLVLIILPQLTMLERAMTAPKRALDSSVALTLSRDAQTCISVLEIQDAAPDADASGAGMAVPSASGMSVPSATGLAVPSAGGATQAGATRPYILQCDRANTHVALVRDRGEATAYLDTTYGLPALAVSDRDPIDSQKRTAAEISQMAKTLYSDLKEREAQANPYTLENFGWLVAARMIPLSPEQKIIEDAKLSKKLMGLVGLRFEEDGKVFERIGLITLARTLAFAIAATGLALILCYPMAYKVALATTPERAVWLFLGLVIPYAIVELMRVYAWTVIIDNNGLLNGLLQWLYLIDAPVQFKRFPGTVFVVIVYTYVLFMVFPIYNVMSTLDRNQIEAAKDLGASTWRVHWRIIIPHSKPGIAVGAIATFMLSAGAFSVPRIISRGLQAEWFSQTIYNKFFESQNSNVGAAYSLAYTVVCFVLVGLFMWLMRTRLKDFARVQ